SARAGVMREAAGGGAERPDTAEGSGSSRPRAPLHVNPIITTYGTRPCTRGPVSLTNPAPMNRFVPLHASGLLALLIVLGTPTASAQDVDCLNIPDLAIAEPPEYAQCRPPMVYEETESLGGLPAFGTNLRVATGAPRDLISFEYDNPAAPVVVGTHAESFFAGDFAGDDFSKLYAINFPAAGVPSLYTINPVTGAATLVAATNLAAGDNAAGMAWDYTTNTMYVTVLGVAGNTLNTLNLATGALTVVGPLTGVV